MIFNNCDNLCCPGCKTEIGLSFFGEGSLDYDVGTVQNKEAIDGNCTDCGLGLTVGIHFTLKIGQDSTSTSPILSHTPVLNIRSVHTR